MKTRFAATEALRSALQLVGALVILAAQVGVVGAGVLDGREGTSAASHLESSGTNLHFAHNEADCFMCRAQHLGDAVPLRVEPPRSVPPLLETIAAQSAHVVAAARLLSNASRAPPTTV